MTDAFSETAGNLNTGENVQDDLSPAEQAAYAPIYEGAHGNEHSMVRLTDDATCARCAKTARAVVEAVRPHLTAQYCIELAVAADQLGPITGDNLRDMARTITEGSGT